MKKLYILFLFISFNLISQTPKSKPLINSKLINKVITTKNVTVLRGPNNVLEYRFCDENGDGFMELDITQIEQDVLSNTGLGNNDNEAILISTEYGYVIKANNSSANNTIQEVCNFTNVSLSDVAVDETGELYICSFSNILETDQQACTVSGLFSFNFGIGVNALSFDTNGNLYYGNGTESKVYRYNANEQTPPYLWHNFGQGRAGGDFVMLNGKLYVSWVVNNIYKLYEVTVDTNINYVSHIDLGEIPYQTYGLASELGTLYGVTPSNLFKINLDNFTFSTVIENDGTYGDWFGAAGLHEAIILETSSFETANDANNQVNQLPSNWSNTVENGQVIYVRIEDANTGIFEIVPVTITINNSPQITKPNDLIHCEDQFFSTFDLTLVEDELLANVTGNYTVNYYKNIFHAEGSIEPLNTNYQNLFSEETIFVRVQNVNNECYAITDFMVFVNQNVDIAPLIASASERELTNCYINSNEFGYFNFDEMYSEIVLDGHLDYDIEYYYSLSDAEENINQIDPIYYGTIGLTEEIFVRVTNDKGCYKISNFYINGNCILNSNDMSSLHFPSYFTPNNDGYHDTWNIKGISQNLRNESTINIFNRYGKLLYKFNPTLDGGWKGYVNNLPLPSDDYWYIMTTPLGEEFVGHFSLLR